MILELVHKTGYNKESSVVGHFGTKIYDMRQSLCREGDQLCRISYVNLLPEEGNNQFVKHGFSTLEQLQCTQYQSERMLLMHKVKGFN